MPWITKIPRSVGVLEVSKGRGSLFLEMIRLGEAISRPMPWHTVTIPPQPGHLLGRDGGGRTFEISLGQFGRLCPVH